MRLNLRPKEELMEVKGHCDVTNTLVIIKVGMASAEVVVTSG